MVIERDNAEHILQPLVQALGLRDKLRVLVFTFVACMLTFASVVIAAVKL